MIATEAALNYMPIEGNDWERWRAIIWNSMALRFGYPGLAPLEQWMRRSKREKRCLECGAAGTIQEESVIVKAVSHYWMCAECGTYWRNKAVEG